MGVEISGHNKNSYARYSIALLSSVDGNPGLTTTNAGTANPNTARTYDTFINLNEGFQAGGLGVQRVGVFGYFGQNPTYYLTSGGVPVEGQGNRSFSRVGAYGWWFLKDLDIETLYMHGQDNVYLGNGIAVNDPAGLPQGAAGPSWNGGFMEAHYTYNPQLIFTGRYELVHMSRQANPTLAAFAKSRQRGLLYHRLPLVPDHVEPRGAGLSQRILAGQNREHFHPDAKRPDSS